ncbi:MAG: nuclear transport factor 2 family protein [Rubrivivax sp.]|nr:nuclear transport factor 2 family protein [Rubrivivax sp.]
MNNRLFAPLLAALCAACGTSPPAAPPSAVFDRYVAAVHAADMVAVRALIAPGVERSDFPGCRPEMDNPTCLAHYIEATVVKPRARLTEVRRRVEGDTVLSDLEVRSPLYEAAGAPRILGRDIVRVRDGRITAFRFVPDFADEPTANFFATLGIGPRARRP